MTTKKAVKKVTKKDARCFNNSTEMLNSIRMIGAFAELERQGILGTAFEAKVEESKKKQARVLKEAQTLNLTKAFALFTAGMLAGAVIMKFL